MAQAQAGDLDARDRVARLSLPLVEKMAAVMARRTRGLRDPRDLFSWGLWGLLRAIDCWDASRGVPFEPYASLRIKGAMLDGVREQDFLPRSRRRSHPKVEFLSLEGYIEDPEKDFDLVRRREVIPDESSRHGLEEVDSRDAFEGLLSCLDSRLARLLTLIYRLDLSMKECSQELAVSPSRISQLHRRALEAIRQRVRGSAVRS